MTTPCAILSHKMKAAFLKLAVSALALWMSVSAGPCPAEEVSFKTDNESVHLWGALSKPDTAFAGDFLFRYSTEHSLAPLSKLFELQFLGRTGHRTFDVESSLRIVSRSEEEPLEGGMTDRLTYYFLKGDVVPVQRGGLPGCSEKDTAYLKMIHLKGNQLKYQILLPECLKKLLPSNPSHRPLRAE